MSYRAALRAAGATVARLVGMKIFLISYGIMVAVAAAVLVRDPGFVGNVGFLIFGAVIGIYPVFIIDEINRSRSARNVAAIAQRLHR